MGRVYDFVAILLSLLLAMWVLSGMPIGLSLFEYFQ